jgi:hypothetical protein
MIAWHVLPPLLVIIAEAFSGSQSGSVISVTNIDPGINSCPSDTLTSIEYSIVAKPDPFYLQLQYLLRVVYHGDFHLQSCIL